jgi:hypothetical protein
VLLRRNPGKIAWKAVGFGDREADPKISKCFQKVLSRAILSLYPPCAKGKIGIWAKNRQTSEGGFRAVFGKVY